MVYGTEGGRPQSLVQMRDEEYIIGVAQEDHDRYLGMGIAWVRAGFSLCRGVGKAAPNREAGVAATTWRRIRSQCRAMWDAGRSSGAVLRNISSIACDATGHLSAEVASAAATFGSAGAFIALTVADVAS